VFQIKSFHLKSNHQNGSNRDLKPNRDWDLPITGENSVTLTLQQQRRRPAGQPPPPPAAAV